MSVETLETASRPIRGAVSTVIKATVKAGGSGFQSAILPPKLSGRDPGTSPQAGKR